MITELIVEDDVTAEDIRDWKLFTWEWPRDVSDEDCQKVIAGGPKAWKLRLEAWLWMRLNVKLKK